MELERLVPKMTKLYLHRTLESVLKDVRRPDEDVARDLILKNRDALADRGRIKAKLDFLQLTYDLRVLSELCLGEPTPPSSASRSGTRRTPG